MMRRSNVAAACLWAFSFAAMSLYWSLGGRAGLATLGEGIRDDTVQRKPAMIGFLWLTVALKTAAGLFPLGLLIAQNRTPRRLSLVGTDLTGAAFLLYAFVSFLGHGLMLAGRLRIPRLFGTRIAVRWHFFAWDPHLLLGAVLLLSVRRTDHSRTS